MSAATHYQKIYAIIRRIPRGRVATYGQIAALAGIPRHARQVGYALRNTPDDLILPWHRVINAQGKVSMRSRPGCDDFQHILLAEEGIEFGLDGKISLKRYQWKPRYASGRTGSKKSITRPRTRSRAVGRPSRHRAGETGTHPVRTCLPGIEDSDWDSPV